MTTQSSLDRAYAELPAAGAGVRDLTPGGVSIANSPRRRVGRSINDPNRTAERMGRLARQSGNLQMQIGLMQRADGLEQRGIDRAFSADQAGLQRAFTLQRDQAGFAQAKEMRGIDQAFSTEQAEKGRQHDLGMYGLQAGERAMAAERGRVEAERERELGGIDSVFMLPTGDGSGAVPMVKDKAGRARMAGGFMPTTKTVAPPTPEQSSKIISDAAMRGMTAAWDGKQWKYSYLRPQKAADQGSDTTTFDADGTVFQRVERRPVGGAGPDAAGSKSYF